jgi:hypothetical protein
MNDFVKDDSPLVKPPVKKGRPRKADIEAIKNKKNPVGRPKGTNSRIEEFKARLMGTSGDKIMETLIKKALDNEDKDQMAALKMCVDRLLPMSAFDKKQGGVVPSISINISSLSEPEVVATQTDAEDVEFTDYEEGDND